MITVSNIVKSYKQGSYEVSALKGVSFEIKKGDFVTIMGPSGSGKSTMLHILGLLDEPTSGEYLLEGASIVSLSDKERSRIRNRHYGFVFQSFNLIPELTAVENVELPMLYTGMKPREARDRAIELLTRVGLGARIHHYPSMLSGGEQQRVAVARSISNEPDVILADEPTGNLPSAMGREILDLLLSLNAEGVTLVMVTHDPNLGALGRTRVVIEDGLVKEINR